MPQERGGSQKVSGPPQNPTSENGVVRTCEAISDSLGSNVRSSGGRPPRRFHPHDDVVQPLQGLAPANSTLTLLRRQGLCAAAIVRIRGRHRSTVGREVRRNTTRHGGWYRAEKAHSYATARRARSRRHQRCDEAAWPLVRARLVEQWSPEHIAGRLRVEGTLSVSHETIYRYLWADRARGGTRYTPLRMAQRDRRKRYGRSDSRGRLAGKRALAQRPPGATHRSRLGHLEGDTVMGSPDQHGVLTLVNRTSGHTRIGTLTQRTVVDTSPVILRLFRRGGRPVHTVTVDKGTEFHGYQAVEAVTPVRFYVAPPHHAWERGTTENTNGLIRQSLPKGQSMRSVTQADCDAIAHRLNTRPRQRLGYRTPEECDGQIRRASPTRTSYFRSGVTTIVADPTKVPFFAVTACGWVDVPPVAGTLMVSG